MVGLKGFCGTGMQVRPSCMRNGADHLKAEPGLKRNEWEPHQIAAGYST